MFNKKISRNWLWMVVVQFLVFVPLAYLSEKIQSANSNESIMVDGHIHRTLYLARDFNEEEQEIIGRAAQRWNRTTNHIVDFKVVMLPDHSWFDHLDEAVMVATESEDHPDVLMRDAMAHEHGDHILAFVDEHRPLPLLAVVHERIDRNDYEKVIMHELGHILKLEHNKEDLTLMSPLTITMSAGISRSDLIEFCKLYHCDPNQLQDEEEALHP